MAEFGLGSRLKHAWNAFFNKDPTVNWSSLGGGSSIRPDRSRFSRGHERSIVTAVYNRIAMDVAAVDIKHVKLDENGRFVEIVRSGFVPTDTDDDPTLENGEKMPGSFDVLTMRTGRITEWFPTKVRVEVYNERIGRKEEIIMPKQSVGIIENPLYAVMNEPNSTLQRLIRKLNILDVIDEQSGSGKLDLIIQLPYLVKTEAKKRQAEERRLEIERQLKESKYGIAYIDGTEHITQLNRSVENNLMSQIEYLTSMLYSQLGITQSILDGSADDRTMLNYYNRTVEPILSAITDELKRKFLTKTARSQKQSIEFFRDPFKLVPVSQIAEIADKFTRNAIMTSNEFRQVVGMIPADDPDADVLRNKNLNPSKEEEHSPINDEEETDNTGG